MRASLVRIDVPATDRDLGLVRKMLEDVKFGQRYRASGDVAAMRAATAKMVTHPFFRRAPEGLEVISARVGGIPGEWIVPSGASDAVLLFLHGGGYVRGSLDLGRANAAEIAIRSGLRVFAAAYRQAPEDPFPAAFDDAVAVARSLGREHRRFALVGESAGGGLALAAAMGLRDAGAPMPFAIGAISPFMDLTLSGESWAANAGKDIATRAMGEEMIRLYVRPGERGDWRASPVFGDLAGLPPIHIMVGGHEGLFSETLLAAERAAAAGCDARLDVFEAMPHGFTKYDLDSAATAMERVGDWLADKAGHHRKTSA